MSPSLWEQNTSDWQKSKAGGFNIFDPHDVPIVGTFFCQEVHEQVGRGSIKRPPWHMRGCDKTKLQQRPLSSLRRGMVLSTHPGMGIRLDLESSSVAGFALWLEASCLRSLSLHILICKM